MPEFLRTLDYVFPNWKADPSFTLKYNGQDVQFWNIQGPLVSADRGPLYIPTKLLFPLNYVVFIDESAPSNTTEWKLEVPYLQDHENKYRLVVRRKGAAVNVASLPYELSAYTETIEFGKKTVVREAPIVNPIGHPKVKTLVLSARNPGDTLQYQAEFIINLKLQNERKTTISFCSVDRGFSQEQFLCVQNNDGAKSISQCPVIKKYRPTQTPSLYTLNTMETDLSETERELELVSTKGFRYFRSTDSVFLLVPFVRSTLSDTPIPSIDACLDLAASLSAFDATELQLGETIKLNYEADSDIPLNHASIRSAVQLWQKRNSFNVDIFYDLFEHRSRVWEENKKEWCFLDDAFTRYEFMSVNGELQGVYGYWERIVKNNESTTLYFYTRPHCALLLPMKKIAHAGPQSSRELYNPFKPQPAGYQFEGGLGIRKYEDYIQETERTLMSQLKDPITNMGQALTTLDKLKGVNSDKYHSVLQSMLDHYTGDILEVDIAQLSRTSQYAIIKAHAKKIPAPKNPALASWHVKDFHVFSQAFTNPVNPVDLSTLTKDLRSTGVLQQTDTIETLNFEDTRSMLEWFNKANFNNSQRYAITQHVLAANPNIQNQHLLASTPMVPLLFTESERWEMGSFFKKYEESLTEWVTKKRRNEILRLLLDRDRDSDSDSDVYTDAAPGEFDDGLEDPWL